MTDDIDRWLRYSEFMGETKEAVKDIRTELIKLREGQINILTKISKISNKVDSQSVRTGIISGVLGMFSGFIISIIFNAVA